MVGCSSLSSDFPAALHADNSIAASGQAFAESGVAGRPSDVSKKVRRGERDALVIAAG